MNKNRRYSITDDYKEMVQAAKKLNIRYVGRTKHDLVNDINGALDAMDYAANEVTFNRIDAKDILDAAEYSLLMSMVKKIDDTIQKRNISEMQSQLSDTDIFSAWQSFGGPPFDINFHEVSTNKNIDVEQLKKELANKLGMEVDSIKVMGFDGFPGSGKTFGFPTELFFGPPGIKQHDLPSFLKKYLDENK